MGGFQRFWGFGISVLLLSAWFLPSPGLAAVYYVSNSGNDANTGLSPTAPWQTLAKVGAGTFSAGDQILFRRGDTFYGSLTINQSGASGNPITFSAYGSGANPVITGFTQVAGWTNLGGNVWESSTTVSALAACNLVTVNGVNTAMGRFPNAQDTQHGYLTIESHPTTTSLTNSTLTGTPDWTGAEVVIRTGNYQFGRRNITAQTGGTLTYNADAGAPVGNGFFIQNDARTLDRQNEWYFNPNTQSIRVYSVGQPGTVQVASVENLVTLNGNYLTFDQLAFTGANGCAFYDWDHSPRYNHVAITNCSFSNLGVSAIYTLINYLTVENNTVSDTNCNAISTSYGTDILIRNNTLQNIGVLSGGMRNLSVYSLANSAIEVGETSNWTAEYNVIKNVAYCGISFYGSSVLVKNNFIDTFCVLLDDGGGIYTYTGSRAAMSNVVITGNVVVNSVGAPAGVSTAAQASGIYLDEQSENVEVANNSVGNVFQFGVFMTSQGHINTHDNTVYNATTNQYYSTWWGSARPFPNPPTNNQVNNNIFVSRTKDGTDYSSPQHCLAFYFNSPSNPTPILASTTADNNYYARPMADDKVVFISLPAWADCFKTLTEWKAFSGQDAHSHGAPQTITDVNDLQFVYNGTQTSTTLALTQPMLDMKGNKYWSSITLQPFTSAVLMKDHNPASPTPTRTATPIVSTATITPTATIPFTLTPTTTSALAGLDLKGKTALAFPNPASDQVRFLVRLSEPAEVKIILRNVSGRLVAQLRENLPAGQGQALIWDCRQTAPGIYLAQVWVDGRLKESQKIAVLGK